MMQRRMVLTGVGAFVLAIIAANAHLAYVAFASAPLCVAHAQVGDASPAFSAAKSSC
jgi:hypothetical protein